MDTLASSEKAFPAKKSAPVILYDEGQASAEAFATVRKWGYKNTSVMAGGFEGWKKAEGKIVSGELPTEIVYVKKLKPGQVSVKEFGEIVAAKPSDKVIRDVRGGVTPGVLPGAIVI